jgi:hypothetical protein
MPEKVAQAIGESMEKSGKVGAIPRPRQVGSLAGKGF